MMSPASSHTSIDTVDSTERMKRVPSSPSIYVLSHPGHVYHQQHSQFHGALPGSVFTKLWSGLSVLDMDPHPEVAKMANAVTGYIRSQVPVLVSNH